MAAFTDCVLGDSQGPDMRDSLDQDVMRLEARSTEPASREYYVQAGSIAKAISTGRKQANLNSVAAKLLSNMMAKKLNTVVFVDDWNLHHRLIGEVHCGSEVKRDILAGDGWTLQPRGKRA